MEKRRPAYDLDTIKAAIGSAETLAMTRTALSDALSLGFNRAGISAVIQSIQRRMFYKSIPRWLITAPGRTSIMCRPTR
jgi:motility quorum-sensing regulator/GCU-specific mRNA interferase toxin